MSDFEFALIEFEIEMSSAQRKPRMITGWADLVIAKALGLIDLLDPTDRELLLNPVGDLSGQDEIQRDGQPAQYGAQPSTISP